MKRITVKCPEYPQTWGRSIENISVDEGMTSPDLIARCERVFRLSELRSKNTPLCTALFTAGGVQVQGDVDAFLSAGGGAWEFRVWIESPLDLVANQVVEEQIQLFTYSERCQLPLWRPVADPAQLWGYLLAKMDEAQRAALPAYSTFQCRLFDTVNQTMRPVTAGRTYYDLQIGSHEKLVLSPCLDLSVASAFGVSRPMSVNLLDTWEQVRSQLLQNPPPQMLGVSPLLMLRLGERWVELKRRVLYDLIPNHPDLRLHPIINCAVLAMPNGGIYQFVARLPADIPVEALAPGLVAQFEKQFAAHFSDPRKAQLVSIVPESYPASLPQGRLGIAPEQTLMDIGVRNGWAFLLLVEGNYLPDIVEPMLPAQPPEPAATGPEPVAPGAPGGQE